MASSSVEFEILPPDRDVPHFETESHKVQGRLHDEAYKAGKEYLKELPRLVREARKSASPPDRWFDEFEGLCKMHVEELVREANDPKQKLAPGESKELCRRFADDLVFDLHHPPSDPRKSHDLQNVVATFEKARNGGATAQQALQGIMDQVVEEAENGRGPLRDTSLGTYFRGRFHVDCDGNPECPKIDPAGQTTSSLEYDRPGTDAERAVDARRVPYVVVPYGYFDAHPGELALVRNRDNGKIAVAVVGDAYGEGYDPTEIGEDSMKLAPILGLGDSPSDEYCRLKGKSQEPKNGESPDCSGGSELYHFDYLLLRGSNRRIPDEKALLGHISELVNKLELTDEAAALDK